MRDSLVFNNFFYMKLDMGINLTVIQNRIISIEDNLLNIYIILYLYTRLLK